MIKANIIKLNKNITTNKPTLSSVILIVVFFWIRPFRFTDIEGTYEQIRFFNHIYNWRIFIPIYHTLFIFSIIELYRIRKLIKQNWLSILLISPIIIFELSFIIKMIYQWITIWSQ
ncbi:MAG: hypothetical protein ACJATI_005628 [Halioglobus sp.]|jgi:hypothetical protein